MLKNAQTTAQLHSFHMLVMYCSKFSKPGFSNVNLELPDVQTGFRKGRGTRGQIANIHGSSKKQDSSRKISIFALLTMPKPLTVWIAKTEKNLKEMGIPDHLTCLLRNLYGGQEATVRTGQQTGSK